nr:PREDICTED: apolipoprotein L3 [Anolis carolinensis]|eukprot:XP_008108908.1 PREDICTED: apolipoprotein L3 [Anolis carolinensis]
MAESKRNSRNGLSEEHDSETVTESGEREKTEEVIRLLREGIEKAIPHLQEMADSIDATNKAINAATIVTYMTNVTSCILNIVAASLAPFTVGTSVALTASGISLGAVAATSRKIIRTCTEFNSKKKEKIDEMIKVCTISINNSKTKLKSLGSSFCQETENIMEKISAFDISEQVSNLADQVSNISDQFSNMTSAKDYLSAY